MFLLETISVTFLEKGVFRCAYARKKDRNHGESFQKKNGIFEILAKLPQNIEVNLKKVTDSESA